MPCAWCPRCRSVALCRIANAYSTDSPADVANSRRSVRRTIGATASIITISRPIGAPTTVINDPERIVRARRAITKVVERLANREVPLMRADRLRPDEAGVWHLDRIVLLRGTPKVGRIAGAAITYSGKAVRLSSGSSFWPVQIGPTSPWRRRLPEHSVMSSQGPTGSVHSTGSESCSELQPVNRSVRSAVPWSPSN